MSKGLIVLPDENTGTRFFGALSYCLLPGILHKGYCSWPPRGGTSYLWVAAKVCASAAPSLTNPGALLSFSLLWYAAEVTHRFMRLGRVWPLQGEVVARLRRMEASDGVPLASEVPSWAF